MEVAGIEIRNDLPFVLIAGPCMLESEEHALYMVSQIKEIADTLQIPFIYKTSFDKANRTSIYSKRSIGLQYAKEIFDKIREYAPVVTDIHERDHVWELENYVDMFQIPAFLCRQTDLLLTAGASGKPINIKKGQFLSPWEMEHVDRKVRSTGNENILITERGTTFGYNNLVVDMRSIPIMKSMGLNVCIDATHSVQEPGRGGDKSGGCRDFAPVIANAAVANGVAAVFMEVHENPDFAPSDGPNMVKLSELYDILLKLSNIDMAVKGYC